jgi:hypothetical protein
MLACIVILSAFAIRGAEKTAEALPDPRQKTLETINAKFEKLFAKTPGNGLSRVEVIHTHQPFGMPLFNFSFGTERWKIESLDFIGLLSYVPAVYSNGNAANEKTRRLLTPGNDYPNARTATDFEYRAIADLQKAAVFTEIGEREIRMVGALHATKNCLSCHTEREDAVRRNGRVELVKVPVKEGDVLGAFSYRISRGADADEKRSERK